MFAERPRLALLVVALDHSDGRGDFVVRTHAFVHHKSPGSSKREAFPTDRISSFILPRRRALPSGFLHIRRLSRSFRYENRPFALLHRIVVARSLHASHRQLLLMFHFDIRESRFQSDFQPGVVLHRVVVAWSRGVALLPG